MNRHSERILRSETIINHPQEFKVRRRASRRGRKVMDWFPLCRGVAHLYRYAEVTPGKHEKSLDGEIPARTDFLGVSLDTVGREGYRAGMIAG